MARTEENILERDRWAPQQQFWAGMWIYVDSARAGWGDEDRGGMGKRQHWIGRVRQGMATPKPGWWLGIDARLEVV